MRRWGLAALVCVLVPPRAASAQEAEVTASASTAPDDSPAQAVVYGAMPGGLHAPTAETLPRGSVEASTLVGLGRRTGLLGSDHKFNRGIGDLAIAFGATEYLTLGLSLDGRYDRHWGQIGTAMPAANGDDGYVGDPHLLVRVAKTTGNLRFGGQLGLWVPGRDAPSVAGSAISFDVRGLASLPAGPGLLSLSAGFRLDNSANSVDDAMRLSLTDRVSLGVSDYHALFAGLQFRVPVGKLWLGFEGSLDAFVGGPSDPADGEVKRASLARGKLTLRGGVTAGYPINDQFSVIAFVEAAKVPGINDSQVADGNIPLVPYEPIVTGGVGLQARFGRTKPAFTERECARHTPPDCPELRVVVLTDVTGTVVDTGGKPVIGAKVLLTLKNAQVAPVVTDETGSYRFKGVLIGHSQAGKPEIEETAAEIAVELAGMKPGKSTIAQITEATNKVPSITLEPALPPGQLRGVVRSLPGGKAVLGATITITGSTKKATTAEDGTFTVDLAPGQYKIKVVKPGLSEQTLDVTIDPNGVAIKNIDLHK